MEVFKQIRISKELLDKVKISAKNDGLTVSAWIRLSITEKLKKSKQK